MRRLLPLVFLLFLTMGCGSGNTGQTPGTENPPPAAAATTWEWTTDAEGGFKVEMPGRPERIAKAAANFLDRGNVNQVAFSVQKPEANALLNYWDLDTPQTRTVAIDTVINVFRDKMNTPECAFDSERTLKLKSGQTAREATYRRVTGTLTVRWVSTGRRLFMMIYSGKTADLATHQTATARFLDSFELTGALANQAAGSEWTDYEDPDGRFRASFRGKPQRQTTQVLNPKLGMVSFDICEAKEDGQSMAVIEVTLGARAGPPLPADQVLDELRDAHVRRQSGQITSEKAINLEGLPGREVVIATARQGTATLRYFTYDGKYFVVGSQGLQGTPPPADTARFFESFRFRSVDWLTFAPSGGRFSARFPKTPQQSTNPLPGPRGQVQETVHRFAREDATFSVGVADYDGPAGQGVTMDQVLASLRDNALRSSGARVMTEQPISLGIAGGREVVAELPNRAQVRFRWIAHNRRVYSVGVVGLKPGQLPAEDTAKFLESFKILP
jgi:hypothetical protein